MNMFVGNARETAFSNRKTIWADEVSKKYAVTLSETELNLFEAAQSAKPHIPGEIGPELPN